MRRVMFRAAFSLGEESLATKLGDCGSWFHGFTWYNSSNQVACWIVQKLRKPSPMRIPGDADQRSEVMAIAIPN